jgi:hypothetical protein
MLLLGVLAAQAQAQAITYAAYFAGGRLSNGTRAATVAKLDFNTEVRSNLAVGLSVAKINSTGFASSVAGYSAGGDDTTSVDKFEFSNDSRVTLAVGIQNPRTECAGFESDVSGYVEGGGPQQPRTFVEKFSFATDARTVLPALSANRTAVSGASSSTHGYGIGSNNTTVTKREFSTDSYNATALTLTHSLTGRPATESDLAAYVFTNNSNSFVQKILFSTDTASVLAAEVSSVGRSAAGAASIEAGYVTGGNLNTALDVIEKLDFSTEAMSTIGATLNPAVSGLHCGFEAR